MITQNIFFLVGILVCSLMLGVRFLASKKDFKEMLSYECGFESYKINRLPFSLNFFMFTIIFVLFDLEIILLVAMIPAMVGLQINVFVLGNLFLLLMLMGLMLEWYLDKLNWIF
uniref:NADH-ubiquinone oxidoreductase chain 3 n=1 Tax=Trichuris ovis TaxID=93034 RepID=J7FCQ3_9BILA|nr:NADH dehydrogenase subunit 3 [Trichuris ovis]AFK81057.1 NADH dehydrogenase subunit 3 [Trichuris ovis]